MKILPIKLPVNLLILSFFIVTSLSNCGQQKDESTVVNADTTKLTEEVPAVTTDSMAVNVNADTAAATGTTESVKKTTVVKTVVTTPPTGTTLTAPVTKPVTAPVTKPVTTTPPVVKAPEPVKPAPVTPTPTPKPVEVPKPVVTPSVVVQPSPGAWIVPAKYKSMKSPYPVNSESLANGKSLYSTHCKSCHGSKGDGNGTKAATLDTKVESFLAGAFKSQTAGEAFYKTTFGRKDMPKYEKKIPDEEDRWAVVNYIRSL